MRLMSYIAVTVTTVLVKHTFYAVKDFTPSTWLQGAEDVSLDFAADGRPLKAGHKPRGHGFQQGCW